MEPKPVLDSHFLTRVESMKKEFNTKQSESLRKHFDAILSQNPKIIGTDDCRRILRKLLSDFISFTDNELSRFGQVLRYYVKTWPRWNDLTQEYINLKKQKINSSETKIKEWFNEFSIYVTLKMSDALSISKNLKHAKSSSTISKKIQTKHNSEDFKMKNCYAILLEGPPSIISSAVFSSSQNDIQIGQHATKPFCPEKYGVQKFINLPYVAVHVNFADISFTRRNVHEIERFITNRPLKVFKKLNKEVSVVKIDDDEEVSVFAHFYFKMYIRQFTDLLDNENQIPHSRKSEFQVILREFLKDIEEAFVATYNMPTNANVTFTIGDQIYIRNKQMVLKDINFYEVITPKVSLSLNYFKAQQDMSDKKVSFISLNHYKSNRSAFLDLVNTSIKYECLFCSKTFDSLFEIQAHFQLVHREEHSVMCWTCRKVLGLQEIVGCRWKHNCEGSINVI